MAYKKKQGTLLVKILGFQPHFIDARCAKTGREITLQLRYTMSPEFKKFLEDLVKNKVTVVVMAQRHEEEGFYWFLRISKGEHIGRRKAIQKEIAYDNLLKECRKDANPAFTGAQKQGLMLGRGGLTNITSTSGLIGGSLIRNIDNQEARELSRRRAELWMILDAAKQEKLNQKKRDELLEQEYYEWLARGKELKSGKIKPLEDNDDNWVYFLDLQRKVGSTARQKMMDRYDEFEEQRPQLDLAALEWDELRREHGL